MPGESANRSKVILRILQVLLCFKTQSVENFLPDGIKFSISIDILLDHGFNFIEISGKWQYIFTMGGCIGN